MWRKVLVGGVFAIFIFLSFLIIKGSMQEKPFKWVYSYNHFSKQPYDAKVFINELPNLFSGSFVEKITSENSYDLFFDPYEFDTLIVDSLKNLAPFYSRDSIDYYGYNANFIALNNHFYSNPYSTNGILTLAIDGGHAQIHSNSIDFGLAKVFKLRYDRYGNDFDEVSKEERIKVVFNKQDTFEIREPEKRSVIVGYDTSAQIMLQGINGDVYGLRYELGYGSISFYSVPHIFTNYDILNGNNSLLESIIGELPNTDTYYSNNLIFNSQEKQDLLGFIHENKALSWSFYLLLLSILLYLSFGLQRKLRPVPVIKPPLNLNLSFLRTISDLHYDKREYRFILNHKMIFLKEFIRHRYHLNVNKIDSTVVQQLSKRSGVKQEDIAELFHYYNELMDGSQINKYEFIKMSRLFQLFKNK